MYFGSMLFRETNVVSQSTKAGFGEVGKRDGVEALPGKSSVKVIEILVETAFLLQYSVPQDPRALHGKLPEAP